MNFNQYVFDFLSFKDKIYFKCINSMNLYLEIKDFFNIDIDIKKKLSDSVLKKYPKIQKLDASLSDKIYDINFLTKLKILDISYDKCNITDFGIKNLNLEILIMRANYKIKDLNYMTNLVKLDISQTPFPQQGLINLNLHSLSICSNRYIFNLNHMTNLRVLYARSSSIKYTGIDKLDLHILDASMCEIRQLSNFKNLKVLGARFFYLDDNNLKHLNLEILNVSCNSLITDLNHMTNLKILFACGSSAISHDSVSNLKNLLIFAHDNNKIVSNFFFDYFHPSGLSIFPTFLKYGYDHEKYYKKIILKYQKEYLSPLINTIF